MRIATAARTTGVIGLQFHHAYVIFDAGGPLLSSNPVRLTLTR